MAASLAVCEIFSVKEWRYGLFKVIENGAVGRVLEV